MPKYDYPLHPGQAHAEPLYAQIPLEEYERLMQENKRLKVRTEELERKDTEHTVQIAKMNGYIHHLEEERRWRLVSEGLPEVEEDCGEIFLVTVETESNTSPKGSYVTSAEFCNGEWYNDSTGNELEENIEREDCFYRSKVTHWRPMPSAPEDDK